MIRRPPRTTRTDTRVPYTTRCRSYDDLVATWAGSAALMQRVELANRSAGRIGDRADARALAPLVLADALTPETAQAIARADSPGQGLAMLFASPAFLRSEEHTSELQSLMRISYAVFCLKKKNN